MKNETWQRNTHSERKHDDKGRRQKDPIGTFFRNLFDNDNDVFLFYFMEFPPRL